MFQCFGTLGVLDYGMRIDPQNSVLIIFFFSAFRVIFVIIMIPILMSFIIQSFVQKLLNMKDKKQESVETLYNLYLLKRHSPALMVIMLTSIHTYTWMHINNIYIHTYIHIHIYTCIHSYIHL